MTCVCVAKFVLLAAEILFANLNLLKINEAYLIFFESSKYIFLIRYYKCEIAARFDYI